MFDDAEPMDPGRARCPRGQRPLPPPLRMAAGHGRRRPGDQARINFRPCPDGIPFCAWRAIEHLAADVLYNAFRVLGAPKGLALLDGEYPAFNESLMVFLPKKADCVDSAGRAVYAPENTRPLNITNTENRILASAVRLKLEPHLSPEISEMQRGFVGGRSMLSNLVDMDESMQIVALSAERGAGVLFDFAAAFPSVSRDFMRELFASLGWPGWLVRFVEALYRNTVCRLSVGGARFDGFVMGSGIRQGCPLSPLLFAVAADLLLRRLSRAVPDALGFGAGVCRRPRLDSTAGRGLGESVGAIV